jgi:peptidylprolyl isomerase
VLAVSTLGLAACGSSSSSTTTTTAAPTTTTGASTPSTAASSAIASIPPQDRSPVGTAGKAPTIVVPPGKPPTQLEYADLIVGTGPVAKPGDTVTAQYVLATYSTRKVIQSSWTSSPFSFTLDSTTQPVIAGFDKGVAGMQAGGRRELIIPPSLGYGDQVPQGSTGIAANDTLVFIIDVLKIN